MQEPMAHQYQATVRVYTQKFSPMRSGREEDSEKTMHIEHWKR